MRIHALHETKPAIAAPRFDRLLVYESTATGYGIDAPLPISALPAEMQPLAERLWLLRNAAACPPASSPDNAEIESPVPTLRSGDFELSREDRAQFTRDELEQMAPLREALHQKQWDRRVYRVRGHMHLHVPMPGVRTFPLTEPDEVVRATLVVTTTIIEKRTELREERSGFRPTTTKTFAHSLHVCRHSAVELQLPDNNCAALLRHHESNEEIYCEESGPLDLEAGQWYVEIWQGDLDAGDARCVHAVEIEVPEVANETLNISPCVGNELNADGVRLDRQLVDTEQRREFGSSYEGGFHNVDRYFTTTTWEYGVK